jgi:hypothetical protein
VSELDQRNDGDVLAMHALYSNCTRAESPGASVSDTGEAVTSRMRHSVSSTDVESRHAKAAHDIRIAVPTRRRREPKKRSIALIDPVARHGGHASLHSVYVGTPHRLTGVAADGGAMERAQAFACAHVQRAGLVDPPQLNAIR